MADDTMKQIELLKKTKNNLWRLFHTGDFSHEELCHIKQVIYSIDAKLFKLEYIK